MFKALKENYKVILGVLKKYLLQIILVILFFIFVSFANNGVKDIGYKNVVLNFYPENEYKFLSEADVMNVINSEYGDILKVRSRIDIGNIEKRIVDNPYVYNAEVYSDLKGVLYVDVVHRKPIVRVIGLNNHNYYIDENANKVPLSGNYTSKVLVANGHIINDPEVEKKIFEISKFINRDKFFKSLIGQIYFEKNGEVILIPKVGNLKIYFGKVDRMKPKFDKLRVLYEKVLPSEGWNKYDGVQLKFKNQIVLNKK